MRELSPWAKRSVGRDQHRERYATYMKSAAWFQRRVAWVEEEAALLLSGQMIVCIGCGRPWLLSRDDLHHVTYDRLGDEAHDDLWPMCRSCHTTIHEMMTSTKTWRAIDRRLANQFALEYLQRALDGESLPPGENTPVAALRQFL